LGLLPLLNPITAPLAQKPYYKLSSFKNLVRKEYSWIILHFMDKYYRDYEKDHFVSNVQEFYTLSQDDFLTKVKKMLEDYVFGTGKEWEFKTDQELLEAEAVKRFLKDTATLNENDRIKAKKLTEVAKGTIVEVYRDYHKIDHFFKSMNSLAKANSGESKVSTKPISTIDGKINLNIPIKINPYQGNGSYEHEIYLLLKKAHDKHSGIIIDENENAPYGVIKLKEVMIMPIQTELRVLRQEYFHWSSNRDWFGMESVVPNSPTETKKRQILK
jgi:hypothetical protein